MMKRKLRYLPTFLVLLVSGCVSVGQKIPRADIEKELSWSSEFKSCFGVDGGVKFVSTSPLISSLIMDWISPKKDDFRAELSDPIGQLVLGLTMNKDKLVLEGPMAAKAKKLNVTKDGHFSYDGNDIPIRWYEVGCFLSGRFPKSWLYHGTSIGYQEKEKVLVSKWNDFRKIKVSKRKSLFCADISWDVFLGLFEENVTFCYDKTSNAGSLSYEGEKLAWEPYEG